MEFTSLHKRQRILSIFHQMKYIARKDREFTTEGGIRERMTAARLEQRETQRQVIERQAGEIETQKREVERLKRMVGE